MKNKKILEVQHISVSFGGVQAVKDVSFCVKAHETVALIGSNGAGKTTVFHILTGYTKPDSGRFFLCKKELTHKPPAQICMAGIARTFQNIRLFSHMTVLENVQIALEASLGHQEKDAREEAYLLLKAHELSSFAHKLAGTLPYGEKRRLELLRALATKPKLLLLDEPAAGQSPSDREKLFFSLKHISESIPILFIEHDMSFIRALSDRVLAMHRGELIAEGTPDAVLSDDAVISSYLGGSLC